MWLLGAWSNWKNKKAVICSWYSDWEGAEGIIFNLGGLYIKLDSYFGICLVPKLRSVIKNIWSCPHSLSCWRIDPSLNVKETSIWEWSWKLLDSLMKKTKYVLIIFYPFRILRRKWEKKLTKPLLKPKYETWFASYLILIALFC